MDPTRKNCAKSRNSAKSKPQTVDTIPSSTLKKKITTQCQSKWNANHKPHAALKGADLHPRVHTNLQAKAMTISANADPSITSLVRHKGHHKKSSNGEFVVEMEKRENLTEAREGNKTKSCHGDQLKVQAKIKSLESDEPKRPSISLVSGRRRSFCDSRIELSEFFSGAGVKVVAVDMPPFMQIHAVSCARKAYDSLEKLSSKTLALTLKKEFDGVYGPAWHCIVGSSFGSFVTHSVGGFLYFSMDGKLYFLLFKTTVQRAAD